MKQLGYFGTELYVRTVRRARSSTKSPPKGRQPETGGRLVGHLSLRGRRCPGFYLAQVPNSPAATEMRSHELRGADALRLQDEDEGPTG